MAVAQECKNQFDEIKKGKKHSYVIFYIEDEKMIKVEAVGDRNASYDSFFMDLTKAGEAECRYGLYDFEYEHQCQGTTEVSKKQKLFLMSWCPDTARIKKKRLYSSSFDALKKALVGVHKYIQATDAAEASKESVEEKLRSTDQGYMASRFDTKQMKCGPLQEINQEMATSGKIRQIAVKVHVFWEGHKILRNLY